MNNLPEKENNISQEEFSTVFSDPAEHTKTNKKGKASRFRVALSACLAVVILLVGTIAVIKLIPEKDQGGSSDNEDIYVLNYETDDIKEVSLKNKNATFKFYSEKVETEGVESGETETVTNWYMDGYDKEMTDSDLILSKVESAVQIEAIREISSKTAAECGMEHPVVTAEITTADDQKMTVLVGDKSTDNAGVYVKIEDQEKIYLVGDSLDEELTFTDLDLASTTEVGAISLDEDDYSDYYQDSVLTSFDKITVSGTNLDQKLVFKLNDNETLAPYTPYTVVEPVKRNAENVDSLFNMLSVGFTVSGAYSYDASNSAVKALGLDKPDFVLSAQFDDYTFSYKFKKQDDGNYAVIGNDSKNVKMVSISDCPFLEYETTDFYGKTVFITSIDNVANLTIKSQGETYSFDIKENPKGDDVNKYIVTCGDKTLKSTYFQSYFQFLCYLQCMDFETERMSTAPELSIIYTYNNETEPTTIDFFKVSAVRYQYNIDGEPMGRLGSSDYKKITKNLERLLEGKQIVVN